MSGELVVAKTYYNVYEALIEKSKLEALKEQKKGMMQKLLTGEIRTPTDEHS